MHPSADASSAYDKRLVVGSVSEISLLAVDDVDAFGESGYFGRGALQHHCFAREVIYIVGVGGLHAHESDRGDSAADVIDGRQSFKITGARCAVPVLAVEVDHTFLYVESVITVSELVP